MAGVRRSASSAPRDALVISVCTPTTAVSTNTPLIKWQRVQEGRQGGAQGDAFRDPWSGYLPPHPIGESVKRRELPSGVQGGAPAENVFGTFYLP